MSKTYLVTGAAGFIGSAVARVLIAQGNRVITVDNLFTGFIKNVPKGVVLIKGNCQDYKIIAELEKYSFDAILHIAGQSSGEISFDDPVYDLQTNTQSTLLLLMLARKTGCKKFVYASSMSVYGDQPDAPVSEDALTLPKSFYAIGKLASENYLRIYQQYGINSIALRLFNVYGIGQNMGNLRQGMVSIYLAQAIKNKHILAKGSPDRYRDFICIDDVVDAFLCALSSKQTLFKVYNVGTEVRTTVRGLINSIKKNLPFDVTVEYKGFTPGDQFGVYADSSRIENELGFTAKTRLDDGIKKMNNWALKL